MIQLKHSNIIKSPISDDRVRIVGEVIYNEKTNDSETYWFDVSKTYSEFLSGSGNPWLACLIPLAVTLGEPLRIYKPIDRVLFENIQKLMHIWKCWYPHLHIVPIEAELVDAQKHLTPIKTAAFFPGGVDSFFTVLRHSDSNTSPLSLNIDDLLCVWGFDVPLHNVGAFQRMRDVLKRAAIDLGKELIDIATNLRETRWRQADWAYLSHNCALACIALMLENRYSNVLIGSTHGYKDLMPWGSHPLTDPLLSTTLMKIIHDGSEFNRVEKTEFISKSEVALRSLRVCWKSKSDKNCCICNKCYRTMTTLAVLGVLDKCSTFSKGSFDRAKIAWVYCVNENDRSFFREIQTLALKKGELEVAKAIDHSFKRSDRLTKFLSIISKFKTKRIVRRLTQLLERTLLARYIA